MAYGAVAAIATFFSPEPGWSAYWSMTFIATILTAWNFLDRDNPLGSTRQMLNLTWLAAFVVAAIIGYQAKDSIFGGHVSSAYSAIEANLQGMSRSSGVARWAAVPGLVCLIRAFHSRRVIYFPIYLGIAITAFYIVYRMQSRGAVFGSVAAMLFCLLVGSRLRRYALPFAVVATILLMILDSPAAMSDQVNQYLMRGQSKEEFRTMTGRTRTYQNAMGAFEEMPVLGRGQWTDRLVINQHVHNSYLQALLNGGVVGFIPYCASWVAGWILFFKLQKRRPRMSPQDRLHLLEAGTVMMFFTVRAIPETTTASFAVDMLVMVAIYVYFDALMIVTARRPRSRVPQPFVLSPDQLRSLQLRKAG
jgi:O-antigen ligase